MTSCLKHVFLSIVAVTGLTACDPVLSLSFGVGLYSGLSASSSPYEIEEYSEATSVLEIKIDANNQIWIIGQKFELEDLERTLGELQYVAGYEQAIILVNPEASAGVVGDVQLIVVDMDLPTRILTQEPSNLLE